MKKIQKFDLWLDKKLFRRKKRSKDKRKSKISIIMVLLTTFLIISLIILGLIIHLTSNFQSGSGCCKLNMGFQVISFEDETDETINKGGWIIRTTSISGGDGLPRWDELKVELVNPEGKQIWLFNGIGNKTSDFSFSNDSINWFMIVATTPYFIDNGTREPITTNSIEKLDIREIRSLEGVKLFIHDWFNVGHFSMNDNIYVFQDFNGDGNEDVPEGSVITFSWKGQNIGEIKLVSTPMDPLKVDVIINKFSPNSTLTSNYGGWSIIVRNLIDIYHEGPIYWNEINFSCRPTFAPVSGSIEGLGKDTANHSYEGLDSNWYVYGHDPIFFDDGGVRKRLEPSTYDSIKTIEFISLENATIVLYERYNPDGIINDKDKIIVFSITRITDITVSLSFNGDLLMEQNLEM